MRAVLFAFGIGLAFLFLRWFLRKEYPLKTEGDCVVRPALTATPHHRDPSRLFIEFSESPGKIAIDAKALGKILEGWHKARGRGERTEDYKERLIKDYSFDVRIKGNAKP